MASVDTTVGHPTDAGFTDLTLEAHEPPAVGKVRRVLVISYRFPPHGGAGVHRVVALARYLGDSGWHPTFLTGPLEARRPHVDPTLLEPIPTDIEVVRTGYIDGDRFIEMMGRVRLARVTRMLTPSFPSMDAGWIPSAFVAGSRILRTRSFDLIYSSAYPMCAHVVAWGLKKRFGIPWVADYRDEWSQRTVMKWPTPVHRSVARRLDHLITSTADRVVTTSPIHTQSFARSFPSGDPEKYQTVLNGFEEERFSGWGVERRPADRPPGFLVCHVGSLFRWRGPEAFLRVLKRLIDRGSIPGDRIAVRFVGTMPELEETDLVRSGIVSSLGYVGHAIAVDWMMSADVLLLVNTESTNILAKTFEYVASGRPVLALCTPGPTADLIRENQAGVVVDPSDEPGIEAALKQLYSQWSVNGLPSRSGSRATSKYSRRATTAQLAKVFDAVVSRSEKR